MVSHICLLLVHLMLSLHAGATWERVSASLAGGRNWDKQTPTHALDSTGWRLCMSFCNRLRALVPVICTTGLHDWDAGLADSVCAGEYWRDCFRKIKGAQCSNMLAPVIGILVLIYPIYTASLAHSGISNEHFRTLQSPVPHHSGWQQKARSQRD